MVVHRVMMSSLLCLKKVYSYYVRMLEDIRLGGCCPSE